MKWWQPWLSCYVALCVASAGAVGVSPMLHVLVEHGGRGHAHLHHRQGTVSRTAHDHHYRRVPAGARRDSGVGERSRLIAQRQQPKLFGIELKQVYRALGGWIAQVMEHVPTAPESEDAGHAHDSLAQMLAAGTVEGPAALDAGLSSPGDVLFAVEWFPSAPARSIFDAQAAGRAPPVSSGAYQMLVSHG